MTTEPSFDLQDRPRSIELRTGAAYANLISNQILFAEAFGARMGIAPQAVIPTAGATGAIEAVRNHIFKIRTDRRPTMMTVRPGYWRARESFEGFGFKIIEVKTQPSGFTIDESLLADKASQQQPDIIYLSLPNNPTGAVFDPVAVVEKTPAATAVMLDLTLPSRNLDAFALTSDLYRRFKGARHLFLAGSTSKSHETAEYRIGWVVCADVADAEQMKRENRNVAASVSLSEGIKHLGTRPTVIEMIESSFALLRESQRRGLLEIIRPERRAETGYVLIRPRLDSRIVREALEENRIKVMWGSEFALTDDYIRLETLEPANIKIFLDVIASCAARMQPA